MVKYTSSRFLTGLGTSKLPRNFNIKRSQRLCMVSAKVSSHLHRIIEFGGTTVLLAIVTLATDGFSLFRRGGQRYPLIVDKKIRRSACPICSQMIQKITAKQHFFLGRINVQQFFEGLPI